MKRDSEGYKKIVATVRKYCNDNYDMNLEDAGELKRLLKLIGEKGEKLSLSTLQRIFFGTNKKQKKVNESTLNILTKFIGYKDIDDFFYKNNKLNNDSSNFC